MFHACKKSLRLVTSKNCLKLDKVQIIGSQTCEVYGPLLNFKKLRWLLHIDCFVDSIWKIDNDYKGTKSYVLSSFLKPILNVFITVANTTILKMVIYVGYMPLN